MFHPQLILPLANGNLLPGMDTGFQGQPHKYLNPHVT